MERVKINLVRFTISASLLLIFSVVNYLILSENEQFELFSYVFFGGLFLYLFFYSGSTLIGQLLRVRRNSLLVILGSVLFLEFIFIIIAHDSLALSVIYKRDYKFFLLFQIIPLSTRLLHVLHQKLVE